MVRLASSANVSQRLGRACAELRSRRSYLADALLLDALNRKDVLSGGGELHTRPNPVAGAAGRGDEGERGERWRRAVDGFFRSVRAARAR